MPRRNGARPASAAFASAICTSLDAQILQSTPAGTVTAQSVIDGRKTLLIEMMFKAIKIVKKAHFIRPPKAKLCKINNNFMHESNHLMYFGIFRQLPFAHLSLIVPIFPPGVGENIISEPRTLAATSPQLFVNRLY